MKEVYVVMYSSPTTGHSFVKSIHAKRERAETVVVRDNYVQFNDEDRSNGSAYVMGYFAHIVVSKLDEY